MRAIIILSIFFVVNGFSQTTFKKINAKTDGIGNYQFIVSDNIPAYTSSPIRFQVSINTAFANTTDSSTSVQDSYSSYSDWCVLLLPTNYSPTGQPCKLVMLAHGAGGNVTSSGSQIETMNLVSTLRSNGYAVFDCNGGERSINMGGHQSVQAYIKAYDYITSNYNVGPNLYVSGYSMGGLSALNVALNSRIPIKAIALLMPVTSIYNQAWSDPWAGTNKTNIKLAYNFADTIYEADKVVGYDPYLHWSTSATSRVGFPPIKIWHGNADPSVDYLYSKKLISYIKASEGEAYMRIVNGGNHSNIWDVSYINTEILYFFNRK